MQNVIVSDLRSEELQAQDKRNLNALIKKAKTKRAAAETLKVNRNTLQNMLRSGSCHPDTLKSIRKYFEENMAA